MKARTLVALRGALGAVILGTLLLACSPSVPELPRLEENAVILAFGNSLTYGTGAGEHESYPAVLEKLIGREVMNAGVPGEVSAEGLRRLPRVLEETSPDLVLLCHGGNDILRKLDKAQAQQNLRSMMILARERGIPVVLLGVPFPGLFLNAAEFYERVAEDTGVPYEGDVISTVLGDNRLKSDHVHANAEGYRVVAEAIRDLLRESGAI